MILTYARCEKLFRTAKKCGRLDTPYRKLANNTYLYYDEFKGSFYVTLHGHIIIKVLENGWYLLNDGTRRSVLTKNRLNNFTPFHVYQEKGVWYLDLLLGGRVVFPYNSRELELYYNPKTA